MHKTKQEIFETVRTHLLSQMEVSMGTMDDDSGVTGCKYRGDGGRKCAVGCLIPDECYDSTIENVSIRNVMSGFSGTGRFELLANVLRLSGIDTGDTTTMAMLARLQYIHDSTPPKNWADELDGCARSFGVGQTAECDPS